MDKKILGMLAVAVLVSASGGFAAGYFLKPGGQANDHVAGAGSGYQGQGRQGGAMGQARGGAAGNFGNARGTIISKDDASITVKLNDGGSMNVFYSDTTKVSKTVEASTSDLAQGVEVAAIGTKNSDGSVTAQTISIGSGFGGPAGMQNAKTVQ